MYETGNGPIPGENYTSDTKNYPWHQPPEFTDLNKALDMLAKKITKFEVANGILTIIELGFPLVRITDMLITAGISEGKWTPDFALLIAGPLTKMIETIAIAFDIEYTVGIDDEEPVVTGEFFKKSHELKNYSAQGTYKILSEEMPDIKADAADQSDPSTETTEPEPSTPAMEKQGFMEMGA